MDNKKISVKQTVPAVVAVILLILLDQFTKIWAVRTLKDQSSIVWIKGVFELQYLENRGAAFGLLQNQKWLFIISVVIVLAAAGVFYYKMPAHRRYRPLRILCIFISAGAVGNMIDRVTYGFVVDFFYFSLIDFPIFNVADIYLTVSMVVFALLIFFYYKEDDFGFMTKKKVMTGDQNGNH